MNFLKLKRVLSSPKLAMVLFVLLNLFFVFGTLKPSFFSVGDGSSISWVFKTKTFLFLIAVFFLNLCFCTFNQFRRIYNTKMSYCPDRGVFVIHVANERRDAMIRRISKLFSERRFRQRAFDGGDNDKVKIWGEKNRLSKWGSVVLHLGLMAIVSGALLDAGMGMEGQKGLISGKRFYNQHGAYFSLWEGPLRIAQHDDFSVTMNDIKLRYKSTGTSGSADVTFEKDGKITRDWIDVNNFITSGSYSVHPGDNGYFVGVIIKNKEGQELANGLVGLDTIRNKSAEQYTANLALRKPECVLFFQFYPDYDPATKSETIGSYKPNNPVLKVNLSQSKNRMNERATAKIISLNTESDLDNLKVRFVTFMPWMTLTVKEEPGLYFVYTGFWIVTAGLIFIYAFPYKSIVLSVIPEAEGFGLYISGSTQRFKNSFQAEMQEIERELIDAEEGKSDD